MAKKSTSPVYFLGTLVLAAAVGLAFTSAATAQDAGGAGESPQTQSGAPPSAQSGQSGQSSESPSASPSQNAEPGSAQNQITATGCLQKSSAGGYQLTDSTSMKTYDLNAASSSVDLEKNVGHTVMVTGSSPTSSAENQAPGEAQSQSQQSGAGANPAGSAGSAAAPEQLSVTSVKSVSSSCSAGQ